MTKTLWCAVVVFLLLTAWTSSSRAQVTTGTISGTVRDSSGAAVPGTNVAVLNEDTGIPRTVQSDAAGRYSAPSLSPGPYRVTVSQSGFQTVARKGIVLTVGREAVVNFELRAGAATPPVEITEDASPVDASGAGAGSLANERAIGDLPSLSRSYDSQALLQPGVIRSGPGTESSFEFGTGARFSANGSRGYDNSFLLDGTNINDHANGTPGSTNGRNPGLESVREIRVLTDSYAAEYGRASGAIVSAVTRSGSNQLHGSAYGVHLSSELSARNFFDLRPGGVPPGPPWYRPHQFGGTLGGPVRKDHTFFFGNYEGFRQGFKFSAVSIVPDANARQGLLPTAFGQVAPVPNLVPGMLPFFRYWPKPNGPSLGGGSALSFSSPTLAANDDYFVTRIDHQISGNMSLFGRYSFDAGSTVQPRPNPTAQDTLDARRQYSTIQVSNALRPTLVNAFRFSYNRSAQGFDSLPTEPFPENLLFVRGGMRDNPGSITIGSSLGGIAPGGTSTAAPRRWVLNSFEWGDDLTHVRGRHTIKVGGTVQRIQDNVAENTLVRGSVLYANLLAFLQDRPTQFLVSGRDAYRRFRQTVLGFYGQDELELASRLTLNLGLRWEAVTDPTEATGKISNLRSLLDSQISLLDRFFTVSKKNFEPRAGLAWQLSGKTVLRAGAGIYHDQLLPFVYARDVSKLLPFFQTLAITNVPLLSFIPVAAGIAGPQGIAGGASGTTIAFEDQTPTKYDYHFSFEQELFKRAVVELAYTGSTAHHLWRRSEQNTPIPTLFNGQKFFPQQLLRRNPSLGSVRLMTTDANSTYNAFRVSVRRASASGLEFQAFYTFSKSLDDNSSLGTGDIASAPVTTLDPDDLRRDRGLSDFHAAHQAVFYASYLLPFRPQRWPLALLVQGWKLNAVGTFNSGRPFTAFLGFNRSRNGDIAAPDRPDLVPGRSPNPVLGKPDRWFDPTAFSLPVAGTYGTLGRNTLIGPGFADLDLSVEKAFRIRENLGLQFRAEFFNAINHTNFGQPIPTALSPFGAPSAAAGVITSTAASSRQIQFALKVVF